jgi:tetratricopeptide (TPR) repeat protein
MTPTPRRFWPLLLALPALALLAAGPAAESEPPDDLIRRANAAFLRGDTEAADSLYAAAAERTGDPGLVAFNQAAVLYQKGEFYPAEVQYARVLDDKACPPDRAARAWFNRGTCLLRRGGGTGVYRSAVACFEHCLDSSATDETLRADARHNLELAKRLWMEANRKAARPENPNTPPPEERPESQPPPGGADQDPTNPADTEAGPGAKNLAQSARPVPGAVPKNGSPREASTPTAGNNRKLQPLDDTDQAQPLSPEDTREYLRRTDERLRDERRKMLRLLSGPDRPGVRDW